MERVRATSKVCYNVFFNNDITQTEHAWIHMHQLTSLIIFSISTMNWLICN